MTKKHFIPTINISPLIKRDFSSKESFKVLKEIERASTNVGFFQIIEHGISYKAIKDTANVGNIFFKSTILNKMRLAPKKWNRSNRNIYRGYFPNDVNGKEGLDIGDLKVTKKYAAKLKNQYIEYLNLKKSINNQSIKILNNYYNKVFDLGETLFKSIIKIYNLDVKKSKDAFQRFKTLSTLRFNYYPNQSKPVEISKQDGVALGCETHVDSGIFTILYQDKKGGLQVQNRNNKKWYDVPYNKKALIVNTGLALEYLSKGKFKATNHRVLWNKTKRLSIPFFFEPSYDFKMTKNFFSKNLKQDKGIVFEKFLNQSLKKFIEYQR
tara:strand:- start:69 stop:1040 length:972 start_codon:yes stop_codon:yes gene_type:complete